MTVPGAFNFRDLGGLAVEGGRIPAGRVYRSDLLTRVNADVARARLADLGVGLVVDLRTQGEREVDGALQSNEAITVHHHSLFEDVWSWDDERNADHRYFLRDRTIKMYEANATRVLDAVRLVRDSDSPVVVHCTAGKDRTGTVASALLGLLGAAPEVIVADYARSASAMADLVDWHRAEMVDSEPLSEREQVLLERGAAPDTMEGVVEHVVTTYGSFAEWAASNGFDDTELDALRRRLTG